MPTRDTLTYPEQLLQEALAEYEQAIDEGRPLEKQAFLARYPDLAAQLEHMLQAVERIDALTIPLREALEGRPPSVFPQLEGYEILDEIGRGGMGLVYRARQKGTEQVVALKMLHPEALERLDGDSQRGAIDQFRLEVRAAARLRHPNLVRIHHLGEHAGHPFYAMELIEGQSLAALLKQPGGVPREKALKYLAGVAEAVHVAHQNGILHRDIKPHNILIEERSDEALLADFGLALMERTGGTDATVGDSSRRQSRLAGTIPYMSPEQTRDADGVGTASDIYSLGATLYELLTGRPPFQGGSRLELLERIRAEEPVPPRQQRPEVNARVEQICLKCLHKDPTHRFPTALAFAQVLRRYLQEVRYARNFTNMGTLFLFLGPVVLLINLAVYGLLQVHCYEPVIWLVMFSMYLALFSMFLYAPGKEAGLDHKLSRVEMWSIWGGKFFAAVSISIALRVAFADEPEKAMTLVYPVFAALTGMAVFSLVAKMSRKLWFLPIAGWLVSIAMVLHLPWAPIIYGIYSCIGVLLYGLYLRQLGKELA